VGLLLVDSVGEKVAQVKRKVAFWIGFSPLVNLKSDRSVTDE